MKMMEVTLLGRLKTSKLIIVEGVTKTKMTKKMVKCCGHPLVEQTRTEVGSNEARVLVTSMPCKATKRTTKFKGLDVPHF